MASKTPTWVWVVLGIVGFFVLACAALIGSGIYMVRSHVHTEVTGKEAALQEFERTRARFAGQQPLIELRKNVEEEERFVIHRPAESATRRTELQTIKVMIYNTHEGQLVHIDVPLWFVRLFPQRPNRSGRQRIEFGGSGFNFESSDLSLADVERHGPGLVVDGIDSQGAQVLVWAE